MACDDFPEAIVLWIIGRAFVHQRGRASGEWPVDDVTVASHPTDIGGTPERVGIFQIENPFHSGGDVRQVATRTMQNAFGFAGGAGGVEDVERMLTIQFDGGAKIRAGRQRGVELMPPVVFPRTIVARLHIDGRAGALMHNDIFNRGAFGHGLIYRGLQRDFFAAAITAVAGDDDGRS